MAAPNKRLLGEAALHCFGPDPKEPARTDYYWSQLNTDQQAELKPRPIKHRCLWCKQIGSHTEMCDEMRHAWARMPFGKYKNKPVGIVPEDYLAFILSKQFGSQDVRKMVLEELQSRDVKYRTAAWEQRAGDESKDE